MANNELRTQMQDEAVQTAIDNGNLIVEWGTGVGKSRVAVKLAERLYDEGYRRIALFVTETAHKKNWRNEFVDVLGDKGARIFDSMTVECYASLEKYAGTVWHLLIFDEAHHLRSDNRTSYLATMMSEHVLCLSATLNERGDADLLSTTLRETFGDFEKRRFGIQKAIDNKIIGEPVVHVHVINALTLGGLHSAVLDWGWKTARRKLFGNVDDFMRLADPEKGIKAGTMRVTDSFMNLYHLLDTICENAKNEFLDANRELNENPNPTEKEIKKVALLKTRMLQAGGKRKKLIANAKTSYAMQLLDTELKGKKYICFCNDVEQEKILGDESCINSEKGKENQRIIDAFNDGRINSIFAVGMAQEGLNLKGIETGLIVQLSGKERVFIQKFGRALRSATPEQHVIVLNHTQDAKYFKIAFEGVAAKYVKYRHVENFGMDAGNSQALRM